MNLNRGKEKSKDAQECVGVSSNKSREEKAVSESMRRRRLLVKCVRVTPSLVYKTIE